MHSYNKWGSGITDEYPMYAKIAREKIIYL